MKPITAEIESLLVGILDRHHLLNTLYDYRRLFKGADIESSADFRSFQLVAPGLYLGPEYPTRNKTLLHRDGITHILTCCGTNPLFPDEFTYLILEAEDTCEENISRYFQSSFDFIRDALNNSGKVLIHCQMGLSRSPTILIAYLMSSMNISFAIAHSLVKRARGFISINEGFLKQLVEFDEENAHQMKLKSLSE